MSRSSPLIAGRYSGEEITFAIAKSGGPHLVIEDRIPGGASAGAWRARDDEGRTLVLKVLIGEDHEERVRFQATHLPTLAARGVPVPNIRGSGSIGPDASYLFYPFMPGVPPDTINDHLLSQIFELVEIQAEARIEAPKRDWSKWMHGVLYEGTPGWWDLVSATSSEAALLCERLRDWLAPYEGVVLSSPDFIHGNFHPGQLLVEDDRITGIVDWDHFAIGSRAIDLGSLMVAWRVIARFGATDLAEGGSHLLSERVRSLTGEAGLRQIAGYHVLAGCWFYRRDPKQFDVWASAGFDVLMELGE